MNSDKAVRLVFLGDFKASFPDNIHIEEDLEKIIKSADIRVCNFESPIGDTEFSQKKNNLLLNQTVRSAEFLVDYGFNVILLGNNHIMEHGKQECENTLKAFDRIITVGAGTSSDAFSVKTIIVNGKRIGFFSGVHHEFGVIDSPLDKESFGAAWINASELKDIIKESKKKLDYLIICPHAGIEHIFAPLPEWRKIYKMFIDWGADAVVGYHPHTPQGWEYYKEKPIYYSLGNFFFDYIGRKPTEYWDKGMGIQMVISKDGINTFPFFINVKDGFISLDKNEKTKEHEQYLINLIENQENYNKYINDTCEQLYPIYEYNVLRGLSGTSFELGFNKTAKLWAGMIAHKKNERAFLNILQCESHRWLVERCLRNRLNIK